MTLVQALIIDDNPNNQLVLQQLLRLEDVLCVTISSTRNLAHQLDSILNIDVVFLDLEMPVVNGFEALPIIRAHPNFQAAKIVAYSVHVSEFNTVLAQGFDAFLGKPLNAEAFPDQLARILRGEQVFYLP